MDGWIGGFILAWGLWAVFLLLLAENVFPILPSEVIIPLAGFYAATHELPIVEVIVVASVGAMLGQYCWYWLAKAWGPERFRRWAARWGRWTTIDTEEVDMGQRWFARWGRWAVLVGRVIPVVRGLISIPAGLARMPAGEFLLWSVPSSTLWVALLALAGFYLGDRFPEIDRYLSPLSKAVVAGVVLVYVYRLVTWKPRRT